MTLAPRLTGPPLAHSARGPASRGTPRRRRVTPARAGPRGGLGRGGLRFLALLGFGGGRLGLLCFRFALRLGLLLLRAVEVAPVLLVRLEVGLVPAAALEAEHGYRKQLLQGALAAGGTAAERRIADLLHDLGVVLAGLTLVFVERHELS